MEQIQNRDRRDPRRVPGSDRKAWKHAPDIYLSHSRDDKTFPFILEDGDRLVPLNSIEAVKAVLRREYKLSDPEIREYIVHTVENNGIPISWRMLSKISSSGHVPVRDIQGRRRPKVPESARRDGNGRDREAQEIAPERLREIDTIFTRRFLTSWQDISSPWIPDVLENVHGTIREVFEDYPELGDPGEPLERMQSAAGDLSSALDAWVDALKKLVQEKGLTLGDVV